MLLKDRVAVVFGCWTSDSRKSVLPIFEENNRLLFYVFLSDKTTPRSADAPGAVLKDPPI
jgi:ABC-type branched-subunit amino acid transport system substrate-binding protein